jgi:hypothetical protein
MAEELVARAAENSTHFAVGVIVVHGEAFRGPIRSATDGAHATLCGLEAGIGSSLKAIQHLDASIMIGGFAALLLDPPVSRAAWAWMRSWAL